MHGQFIWYELLTSDVPGALAFYPKVAGWDTEDWDKGEYTMWTLDDTPLGGLMAITPEFRAQGARPGWTPYVSVDDVDAAAQKAASLGGKVQVPPQDIPGTGRFAIVQDPQGAVFGLYRALNPMPGFDGNAKLGRFSWHELMTTDYKAAFDFYKALFRWDDSGATDMGEVGMYQMYGQRGKMYGGMYNRTPEMASVPPFWLPYINVNDVKKATDIAMKNGAKVVNGPMEVSGGSWIVILGDPQGVAIALHQSPPSAGAATPKRAAKKAKKTVRKAAKKVKLAVKKVAKKASAKTASTRGKKKPTRKPATRKAKRR